MKKEKSLLSLFISTLYLSTFTFGGGFVIISLMKSKFVDKLAWINKEEMLDMVAIAQCSPGAIAVNASIVIGYKTFGILGAIVALLGTSLPPLVIISAISYFYNFFRTNKIFSLMLIGMQAGIVSLLVKVIIDMLKGLLKEDKKLSLIIITFSLSLALVFKVSLMYIILILILVGILFSLYERRKNVN